MDSRTDHDPNKEPLPSGVQRPLPEPGIVRFFEAVCREAICEMCQSNRWSVALPAEKYSVIPAIGDGQTVSVLTERGHVVLNIVCDTCGNMKFLLAERVEKWIEDHPDCV